MPKKNKQIQSTTFRICCVECRKPIRGENLKVAVIYNDDFVVCKRCHDTTEKDYNTFRVELQAENMQAQCNTLLKWSQGY